MFKFFMPYEFSVVVKMCGNYSTYYILVPKNRINQILRKYVGTIIYFYKETNRKHLRNYKTYSLCIVWSVIHKNTPTMCVRLVLS